MAKKPMSNGAKVVVVLAIAGIGYYIYSRSKKSKEIEKSVSITTLSTPGPELSTSQIKGFDILQSKMGWSDQERSKNESSAWWQNLASVQGDNARIV